MHILIAEEGERFNHTYSDIFLEFLENAYIKNLKYQK